MTHALWVRCAMCEDFYCTLHREHVHDCACPPIEDFFEHDCDPYAMTKEEIADIFQFENISETDFPSQENAEKQENHG